MTTEQVGRIDDKEFMSVTAGSGTPPLVSISDFFELTATTTS